jgi:hypothetical protein
LANLILSRDRFAVGVWQTGPIEAYPRVVFPGLFVIPKLDAFEGGTFAGEVDDVVSSFG